MIYLLGHGSYIERKRATHVLKVSNVNYLTLKNFYHSVDDPEIRMRLENVALYKWQMETREKYESYNGIMEKLQREHFKEDFYEW